MQPIVSLFLAFCAAALGSGLFALIGFPAPALTGSAAGVSLAGIAGLRFDLPVWLRTGAFVLLGINIGSGVTPDSLQAAAAWPVSIAILGLSLPLGMVVAQWGMVAWMGFDRRNAVLASAPGHLTFVLSLSLEQGGPTARIAVIQSIRVLFLTLSVPLLVSGFFGPGVGTGQVLSEGMSPVALAGLAIMALGLGWLFGKIHVPAAFLMAGMTVSAAGHATDVTPGHLSEAIGIVAFAVMGTLIGSRFVGQGRSVLLGSVWAGLWLTVVNVAVTLAAMGVALLILDVPAPVLVVAYAPGGVEAMAAMAMTLGLNPAFVAAHHVARLLILTGLIPLWMRWTAEA